MVDIATLAAHGRRRAGHPRSRCPTTRRALAATTRLGFESYRAWAPRGWRPAAAALEIRGDPRAAAPDTTWCAWRSSPTASPPATSASPTRPSASARTCGSPAARTVDAVRAPAVVGHRAGDARCTRSALEEAARQGYADDAALHPAARPAPARSTSARAGRLDGRPFAEPLLGLELVEYRRQL